MSNSDGIRSKLEDKLTIVETYVDVPNELDTIVVGDNNLCPKHTENNPMLIMHIIEPNEHDSFDFVDMLENVSCKYSTCLDIKSNVTCIHISIAFRCNDV